MHTRNNGGIDTDLAMNLDTNFAWTRPLVSQSQADDKLEGPESLTEDEVAATFDEIEQRIAELLSVIDPQLELEGYEISTGNMDDLAELKQVDKGNYGRPVHRRHAHMHTRDEAGIDLDTACNLENTFAFELPLTIQSNNSDDLLTGPEDISVDEIDAEFDALKKQNVVERLKNVDIDGLEILEGNVYNFDELARVEAGMVLKSIDEEFSVTDHGARGEEGGWDVASLLLISGFL
ncbi:hypothetical protein BDR04DRAFT_1229899 [Suillus decipiens]|nr:hypothetical protein BDR04DRAFT_1229899 [Suillus decipiens]